MRETCFRPRLFVLGHSGADVGVEAHPVWGSCGPGAPLACDRDYRSGDEGRTAPRNPRLRYQRTTQAGGRRFAERSRLRSRVDAARAVRIAVVVGVIAGGLNLLTGSRGRFGFNLFRGRCLLHLVNERCGIADAGNARHDSPLLSDRPVLNRRPRRSPNLDLTRKSSAEAERNLKEVVG